jgi:hypothetical protein
MNESVCMNVMSVFSSFTQHINDLKAFRKQIQTTNKMNQIVQYPQQNFHLVI